MLTCMVYASLNTGNLLHITHFKMDWYRYQEPTIIDIVRSATKLKSFLGKTATDQG